MFGNRNPRVIIDNLSMGGILAKIATLAAQNPLVDTSEINPQMIAEAWSNAYSDKPFAHRGRPSGAARAKRIARKRRNIRARSAK